MFPKKTLDPIENPPQPTQNFGYNQQLQDFRGGHIGPRPLKQFGQQSGLYNKSMINEEEQLKQQKQNMQNQHEVKEIKRNITDNQLQPIDDINKVAQFPDKQRIQDLYEDNIDYLLICAQQDQESRKENYIENLKNGQFIKITEQMMKEKEKQGLEDEEQLEVVDQFSEDLYQLIKDVNIAIIKILYFFQGIFMGFGLMHSVMIFQQTNASEAENYYAEQGLRLAQSMQLLSILCFLGSLHLYKQAQQNLVRSIRAQSHSIPSDRAMLSKSKFLVFLYGIINILVVISHPMVAVLSAGADTGSEYATYSVLTVVITILSIFGWMISVSNIKSPIDYSLLHHDELEDFDDNSDNDSIQE